MDIVFVSGSSKEARFLSYIADYLKEKYNVVSYFVYTRKFIYKAFKKELPNNVSFKGYDNTTTENDIAKYLNKYNEFSLSLLAFSDPILRKESARYALGVIVSYLKFWEDFLSEKEITAVLHYPTAAVLGRTSYLASKKLDIKHLTFQTGIIVNENFSLCDINENWIWSEFLGKYLHSDSSLPSNIEKQVNDVVDKLIATKNKSMKIRRISLRMLLAFMYNTLREKRFDRIERNEFRKLIYPFLRKIPLVALKYDLPQPNEKNVFFPLHISWDAQIATRNPLFANQFYLVEILSRSLPYGYWLYVKEHPYNYGGESIKLLKRIKRFPNVKLIHPEISSLDLIRNACGVATINSTAGLEGIVLKKPVITFGKTFYAYFKYTHAIDNLGDLPEIMQNVLLSGSHQYGKNFEYVHEWQKFLWSVLSTGYRGAVVSYKNYMGLGTKVFDENIKATAESIYRKLNSQTT